MGESIEKFDGIYIEIKRLGHNVIKMKLKRESP